MAHRMKVLGLRLAIGIGSLTWAVYSSAGYVQVTPGFRAQVAVSVNDTTNFGAGLLPESTSAGVSVHEPSPTTYSVTGTSGSNAIATTDVGVLRAAAVANPPTVPNRQIAATATAQFLDRLVIPPVGSATFTTVSASMLVDGLIDIVEGSTIGGGRGVMTSEFSVTAPLGKVRSLGQPRLTSFLNDSPSSTFGTACVDGTSPFLVPITTCVIGTSYSYTTDKNFLSLITETFEIETGVAFDFGFGLFVNALSTNVLGSDPFTVETNFYTTAVFTGFGVDNGLEVVSEAFGPLLDNGGLLTYRSAIDALEQSVPEPSVLALLVLGFAALFSTLGLQRRAALTQMSPTGT